MTSWIPSVVAAFALGLGGGAHCALMCGGISSAMVSGAPDGRAAGRALLSQVGRISSYAFAGTLAAGLSSGLLALLAGTSAQRFAQLLLGVAWIAVAVRLLGGWSGSQRGARLAIGFWRRLQPLTRKVWPVNSAPRAFAAGAIWGWLPCGMSYAMLVVAAATAEPMLAAVMMSAFGIGTMPGTLLPALLSARLQRVGLSRRARGMAAVAMLALGLSVALGALLGGQAHAGHGQGGDAGEHPAHHHQGSGLRSARR